MVETAKLRASTIGRTSIFTLPSRTVSESKFKNWPPTSPESENLKKGQRVAIELGPGFILNKNFSKFVVSQFQNLKDKLVTT